MADRGRGRLARPADLRGGRRRRPRRDGGHARVLRARPRAGGRAAARPPAGVVPARPRGPGRRGAGRRRHPRRVRARQAAERHRAPLDAWRPGSAPPAARRRTIADDGTVTGEVPWVPDAPGADVLVVVGADGRAAAVRAEDAEVEAVEGYDRTRSLGHVRFDGAPGTLLERRRHRRRLVHRPGAAGGRVARRGRAGAGGLRRLRQGALHVRARDRLLPGGQARPRGDPAAARERPLAHVLHGLGGPGQARRVPARRVRVPPRGGPGARPRGARADLRPRRDRRDVGARRAAVLPPRAALAAAAGGHGRRRRPGGRRAADRGAEKRPPRSSSTRS